MTTPSAIVVGGGLAGMVVARELALRRWRVTLLDRSERLGGKAGSDTKNGRLVEHGFTSSLSGIPKDLLLEEICEYLPITPADVESWELNSNIQVPLFINTIGAWPNRPRPKSRVKNLYLAGDFVKNAIDLACMEGAVSAALETAGQILGDSGETESLPVAKVPPVWPRLWMVAPRILLIPLVAVARVIAWLEEKLSPHRPDASRVRLKATPKLRMDPRPPRKR